MAQQPHQRHLGLRGAEPPPLSGGLPEVALPSVDLAPTLGHVLEVLAPKVADAYGEVEVEPAPYRGGVAVGDAAPVAPAVAEVPLAAPLKVVGKQLPVHPYVVPRQRLAAVAQPAAHLEVAAVDAVVAVPPVALEPRVHPVAGHRPAAAEVELHAEVWQQDGVVEQVGFQRHVERPVLPGGRGGLLRLGRKDVDGVLHRFRLPLLLVPHVQGGGAKLGEEAALHVAPRVAPAEHAQPALAAVAHLAVVRDPFGGVAQDVEHLVAVGHVLVGEHEAFKPLPVDALRDGGEPAELVREIAGDHPAYGLGTALGEALVEGGAPLGGGAAGDAQAADAAGGVPEEGAETLREGAHARAVITEIGVEARFALTEIDAHGIRAAADAGILRQGMPGQEQQQQEEDKGSFHRQRLRVILLFHLVCHCAGQGKICREIPRKAHGKGDWGQAPLAKRWEGRRGHGRREGAWKKLSGED